MLNMRKNNSNTIFFLIFLSFQNYIPSNKKLIATCL